MAEIKTKPNKKSVNKFIASVTPEAKKKDSEVLLELFKKVTECEPIMWGETIIGFGSYEYKNTQGSYNWLMTGFSPRVQSLTLYIMQGFSNFEKDIDELNKNGKVKHSKGCLYIKKLADVDLKALEKFLVKVVRDMRKRFSCSK